jgi:hypothetical protein
MRRNQGSTNLYPSYSQPPAGALSSACGVFGLAVTTPTGTCGSVSIWCRV